MGDFYRNTALFVALVLALLGLLFWWMWRSNRKEEREHAEALAALAGRLGGAVVDPAGARAWSAELLAPLRDETEGLFNRMSMAGRRRFGTALDFRRGRWSVRVGEASVKKAAQNGTRKYYEHRIEVATARLVPMKISRRLYGATNFLGRPLAPDNILAQGGEQVREVPVTVAAEQGQWHQVRLPGPVDAEFAVFTSDPAAAARALNPQAVQWLLEHGTALPSPLHFEAGLVFGTMPNRISPDHVLPKVDVILGLLDRMGVAPGQPPR
jgi:hypothetical protein